MDEPTGAFRPEPAPSLTSWLRGQLSGGARSAGALSAGRAWPVLLLAGAALGVLGGLVVVVGLRSGAEHAVELPQAVRVAVTTVPTTAAPAMVHVAGAVASPGVYPLLPGARVDDVVRQAGGPRPDADVARLNLAAPVEDGSRVHVPAVGEAPLPAPVVPEGGPGGRGGGAGSSGGPGEPVDVNAATEAELDELPGVGPATAAAIVAYREEHGPFASVDALEDVPGIGPAKVAALRERARA
ncbi:MAG: ComEA family DNA-binding protein [Acidimicrobiia bacterium]|nr:ComEA family DNA-binding protein [Acidimicrobiia bacterium]